MKVSVAIITKDAARQLERCLASLAFADEIVVLDQGSADDTAAVCERFGAVLHQGAWEGFGPTKQRAVGLCRNRWVFNVDSDEEVSPELAAAIAALPEQPAAAAFAVNRLSRFLGGWIRHCGWHPDWVVRLFDRERASFDDRPVHESVRHPGTAVRLGGLLRHHPYETMEQYIAKLDRYTSLAAGDLHARGRRCGPGVAVVRAEAAFWRMWLLQGGWRDGGPGLVLCRASAFYVLAKYVKLWRLGQA
ncbi:MAG: glycosyltransferase family 2 protein [bacterium]|nr:glycosyltransferase family 2 protein [bacterium]MBK9776772.1 glycosyltransferase family 2 protein [bacterium]